MKLTLEYWPDEGGFVGRLREIPGVLSQGDTVDELEANVQDAYRLLLSDDAAPTPTELPVRTRMIELELPV